MIKYNIAELVEAETYRWQKTMPAVMTTAPTGEQETFTFNGTVEQCKARGNTECAGASQSKQVQASVEKVGGDMARLTVVYVYYDAASGEGGEGSSPVAGAAGSSSENPEISVNVVSNQLGILTHPLIANHYMAGSAPWMAIKMFAQGADLNATYSIGSGNNVQIYTVAEGLASVSAQVIALVGRAASYYAPTVEMTVSYTVQGEAEIPEVGDFMKIATPEGGATGADGRNWLLAGGGMQIQNGVSKMVKKYLLSGPGGWDPLLYS